MPWVSFSAGVFEAAMLEELAEVKASDVLPGQVSAKKVERLAARLEEVERLYWKVSAKIDDPDTFDAFSKKLAELGAQRTALQAQLADVRLEPESPVSVSWGEFRYLAGAVAAGGDEARERLRAHLRETVEEITVMVVPPAGSAVAGRPRLVIAQAHFRGGTRRLFSIRYSRTSGEWTSYSAADTKAVPFRARRLHAVVLGELDLRIPEHASEYTEQVKAAGDGTLPGFRRTELPARLFSSKKKPKTVTAS
jgi:hypothetical protein